MIRAVVSFPLEKALSFPIKNQQPNKWETYGMTKSRLWHPSDPKHVVIISPWLPVGVDVIRTHIPTGKTVTQTVAWNQSATGLGGLEWSNKNYERIQFELLCSPFYSVLTALISVDKNLSCVRHALLLFFLITIKYVAISSRDHMIQLLWDLQICS